MDGQRDPLKIREREREVYGFLRVPLFFLKNVGLSKYTFNKYKKKNNNQITKYTLYLVIYMMYYVFVLVLNF